MNDLENDELRFPRPDPGPPEGFRVPIKKSIVTNPEFELFSRLCDDIHRIANQIAPDETSDNSVYAHLSGTLSGCASGLEQALDSGLSSAYKAQALRELVVRWRGMAQEYSKRQTEIDQKRAAENVEMPKM
jgi:hypothetical protein